MSKKNNKNDESIFVRSLAPSGKLVDAEYQEYCKFLKKIFKDSSIQNIAFTGGYGVGKSSVLRSYKIKRNVFRRSSPNKFLYLSLGDFSGERSKRDEQSVEAELLREIVARCNRKKVPSSNIELIPERKVRILPAILSGVLIILAYSLLFRIEEVTVPYLSHMFWEKVSLADILYCFFGILLTLTVSLLVYYIIPHIKWSRVSLFDGNVEIESAENQGYLDRFGFELIYAVESIAKQYDYTFVFEDLDRLNPDVYSSLCLKLRNINKIINDRKKIKTLRFIYTINDEMLAKISEGTKFFDYILPLYPAFTSASIAERWKTKYLNEIGLKYEGHIKTIIKRAADENINEFADYRVVQDIQNEYKVLEAIDEVRNKTNKRYPPEWRFIFVVYKVLFPVDYHKIRLNQSVIFTDDEAERENKIARYEKTSLQDTNRYTILRELLSFNDPDTSKTILRTIAVDYFGRSKRWLFYEYYQEFNKKYANSDLTEMFYDASVDNENVWVCLRYYAYGYLYGDSENKEWYRDQILRMKWLYDALIKNTEDKYLSGDEYEKIEKLFLEAPTTTV